MIHAAYTSVLAAAVAAYAPVAVARRLTRGVPMNVRARFGLHSAPPSGRRAVWIHAVSVGEVIAALPLVDALHARHPEWPLVVSTVTETGASVVRARLDGVATHRYFPLDFPGAVRRVVGALDPAVLVCMETELWPNVLRELGRRGVPVMIANGRLSDRSFRRYSRVRSLMRPMLAGVRVLAMQSDEDARRMLMLGAPPERVVVTGNLKHDAGPAGAGAAELWRRLLGLPSGRPAWIAGSTHRGEDEAVIAAHAAVRARVPELALIVAPRHPDRVAEVMALLRARGLPAVRRSELTAPGMGDRVVVLDTVGELAALYGVADVVFVGGSLVDAGGHNMLEPARLGKPVLMGPHTANFREIATVLLEGGGAAVVRDAGELAARLGELLGHPGRRAAMGEAGRRAAASRPGALLRTIELLEQLVRA